MRKAKASRCAGSKHRGTADADIGMIGLGVIRPGQLALLTGSSHLHLGVTDKV